MFEYLTELGRSISGIVTAAIENDWGGAGKQHHWDRP
ncbi:beta-class phenol-soluble modulin [Corynebacterium glyciniphilum]